MIKINKLIIDSYRLYEDTEIDFTQLYGVCSLLGRNDDMENFGSNSVGKSTLIDAILTSLFGKNMVGSALESNTNLYNGNKPNITLELQIGEDNFIIMNDYNINILKIYKNGVPVELVKKKDNFEFIENALGISHFLMKHLIYLSPNSSSIFSESDATAQGKFIAELLNLDFISDLNKKVSIELKALKAEIQLKVKEQEMYHTNIDTLNKQLSILPQITNTDYQPEINSLSGQKYEIEMYINSQEKVKEKVSNEFDKLKTKATELKTEKKLIEAELKKKIDLVNSGVCPTCGGDTHSIEYNADKDSLLIITQSLDEITSQGVAKKAELIEVESDIKLYKTKYEDIKAQLEDVLRKREADNANEAQRGARLILQAQLEDTLVKMINIQEELGTMEDEKYALELITQSSSAKGFIKERIELFLHLYNIELKALAKDLLGAGHLIKIIRDESNKYYLEVVDKDVTLSYSMLSSGFKARIDILLILALNKTVETLTGNSVNILILDEVLSSIDIEGIQATQDLLIKIQHMFKDKLIFVVSHNQSLRFDNTLTIHRANNSSKFIINGE